MSKMITGTSWFPTLYAAISYYKEYGDDRQEIDRKIEAGEIHIGNPPPHNGEVKRWIQDQRWHIETNN